MIQCLTVGFMQENCYIIYADKHAIMIDPGEGARDIKSFIKKQHLKVDAILLTHGHFDHIGAVDEIADAYHCPVYASSQAIEMTQNPYTNLSDQFAGFTVKTPITPVPDHLDINGTKIQVIATPGHTDGDVCYYIEREKALFTGDTLFKESAGRTDFPTGSVHELMQSMRVLAHLSFDAYVYPGHGESSTLAFEKAHNYYLTHLKD